MPTIIAPSGNGAHANPAQAARQRADRLAKATPEQIENALAYLSGIDPEAFEIALTAVTTPDDETLEDEEPIPLCRRCGAMIGIFPDRGLIPPWSCCAAVFGGGLRRDRAAVGTPRG